ncbi:MAG: 3-oxoacyl-[acyl-carrier protein] reductase [Myxococcaceae bacterium]|nr:3-oxoacyl-[acyl-carrier protein] reductase [Myxococcaceae bacterium]
MSDFLLDLSRNPTAKKLIQAAGLPIPLPTPLDRPKAPYAEQVLRDKVVVVGGEGQLTDAIAQILVIAGANPYTVGPKLTAAFAVPGEAFGRRPKQIAADQSPEGEKINGLVFDATSFKTTADLKQIYDFFHPRVRQIARSGRALIIARPPESADSAEESAVRQALEGFIRSFAKEIGKHGATANIVYVADGAEARLAHVARFILSSASAFVTGQPLRVTNVAAGEIKLGEYARPLDGKVVLVTGAARGIGAATAEILAGEGAHVVVLDRPADDAPASETARKINGTVLLADVSDKNAPAQIAKFLKDKFGGVDVVVHNAGITRDKTLANMKPEVWESTIDINLAAVARITDALVDQGVLRDGGRVIALSSIAGIAGNNGQTNYSASKSGIVGLVRGLAPKLAARGITANAIAPGFIETRMTAAIPVAIREVARRLSALGQGGQPSDVGQAITFLATPGSQGLTGQVLRVCGGAFVGA